MELTMKTAKDKKTEKGNYVHNQKRGQTSQRIVSDI
jgi:hypothetical protein